jgi:hypothetical protein
MNKVACLGVGKTNHIDFIKETTLLYLFIKLQFVPPQYLIQVSGTNH